MCDLFTIILRSCLLILFIFTSVISAEIVLPKPSGPYAVTHSTLQLNDESRVDPLDPNHGKRKLMISSFYPVKPSSCEKTCPTQYMSNITATYVGGLLDQLGFSNTNLSYSSNIQLEVCCKTTGDETKDVSKVPLALLSHGLGATRLLYGAFAQSLASAGFAVITIDHTYDAVVVEFSDGSVVPGFDPLAWLNNTAAIADLQDIRVEDVQFVLSQLGSKDIAAKLVPGASCGFNIKHPAVLGHSFGGSTAINLLMRDSRFVGGINLDGTQFGNITDVKKPALMFGNANHSSKNDETWVTTLQHLKGWGRELELKNSTHYTFFDVPLLYSAGAINASKETADKLIGSLEGKRSFQIITTYVTAFLNFVLRGGNTGLFNGPSEEFPEVNILNKTGVEFSVELT